MILQKGAVCPLSTAQVAVEQQGHHVTTAAGVTCNAARLPLDDGGTGQGRQDDGITGRAALAVNVDEHRQVIQQEVQHGKRLVDLRVL